MHTMWSARRRSGRRFVVAALDGVAAGAVALAGCSSSGSADAKKSNVSYVNARVRNMGGGDLAGQPLTLHGKKSKESKNAKKAKVCLVILASDNGKISEVQWRPAGNAAPISWLLRSG